MEPIFHYALPVLLALFLFTKIPKKTILLMGLLTFAPDLDFFVKDMHGILLHNLFFVAILVLIFYFMFSRLHAYLAFYFLTSHLLFDMDYGRPIFWPLYKMAIALHMWVQASPIKPFFEIEIFDLARLRQPYQPYYIQNHGALFLVLVVILLIIIYYKRKNLKLLIT